MRNKYNAKKTEVDGHKFDSLKEALRYTELRTLWAAGEIFDLELQKTYVLIPKNNMFRSVKYKADFVYIDGVGNKIIEDVKPTFSSEKARQKYRKTGAYRIFKIKQKLMYQVHGILVIET